MRHTHTFSRLGLGAAVLLVVAASSRADLINPGFETGDLTGWSTFGPGWRTGAGTDAHSGAYGVVNDVLDDQITPNGDGTVDESYRGIFQNLSAAPGQAWDVSAWLRGVTINKSEAWLEVQFQDGGGGVLAQHASAHLTSDQPYTQMTLTGLVAPEGTVWISVRGIVHTFGLATGEVTDRPDFPIFDDFAASVPEPVSAALVGGVGVVLAVRRQRRLA